MRHIDLDQMGAFVCQLREEERSAGTVEKYQRDVGAFAAWLAERPVSREEASAWREHLVTLGYAPATVNSMLAALNRFFQFVGWPECRVKPLRIQRLPFSGPGQRADPAGIRPPGYHSTDAGEGAAVPAAGDDLCHWDSGERGALYHSGSGLCWTSGGQAQRQGAYDLDSRQAGAKAHKVCQKKPHRLWRGIPHQGRRKLVKKTDLGGDEEPVQAGGSGESKVFPHNLRLCSHGCFTGQPGT